MTVYILLFRGVGGATQLPTAPLREALTGAGFENVATYINSGNADRGDRMPREKVLEDGRGDLQDGVRLPKAIHADARRSGRS